MKKLIRNFILSMSVIFIFVGCGAESELEDMGISYTQNDYFKHGVYKQNLAVLDLFYEAGMPVETEDKDKDTALDNAIYKGHIELIKFLIEEHDAEIDNRSLTYFIRKKFNGDKKGEDILRYLFDNGAQLTEKGADRLSRYYTNSRTMDADFMLAIAKNGLSAKASTQRLSKIYKNFASYVRNKRRNTKTTFKDINQTANNLLPLIKQLIENGADVKRAYSRFNIPFNVPKDKDNWIKILAKELISTRKIDINKDTTVYGKPILIDAVYGLDNIGSMKETVQYLLKNGSDPLVKMKDTNYRYGNRNAISLFCRYSTGLKTKTRSNDFYPELCQTEDVELFKLLFTDTEKYEKAKAKNTNLIKAINTYKAKNYKLALSLYIPYAKNGNLKAQEKVGDLFNGKKGIKEDDKKSAYWYQKAAEQGSNKAQYLTGVNYEFGTGVKKNKIEAKKWYKKAHKGANSSKNKRMIKKRISGL